MEIADSDMEDVGGSQVDDVNSTTMSEPDDPRENLISTAVNFLQNPKVRNSPLATKRAFLEKKGLSKAEIEIAVDRSGVIEHVAGTDVSHSYPASQSYHSPLASGQGPMAQYNPQLGSSKWSKVRDFTAFTIVVGGVGLAVYRLYHYVVKPYFFGIDHKSVEKQVLEMQAEMTKTLVKVQESLQSIQETLQQQEDRLQQLSLQSGAKKTVDKLGQLRDSQMVNELKAEVSSIKGLLLNRRQFPPAPNTTPLLPSWQRSKVDPAPTSDLGPSGDGQDSKDFGTDLQQSRDRMGLDGQVTRTSHGSDALASELITANTNNGRECDSPLGNNVEESDELDPAEQILAEHIDPKQRDLSPSTSDGPSQKNGVLATDDSTLQVVS